MSSHGSSLSRITTGLSLMLIVACSDNSAVGGDTAPTATATSPAVAAPASVTVPSTTGTATATPSVQLSQFGAAIKGVTVEVDLKSSDIAFLIDVAPFFATGTLVSAQPGPVRASGTAGMRRGVVLRIAVDESRRLRSANSLSPPTAVIDVEFPGGAYTTESNQREVDKAIADVVALAPLGTRFALFFGPSNYGTTHQVAGSASWGWIDATQHVHALATAREEPWIDGSLTVTAILSQIDGKASR